jgi:hypothetical protein
MQEIPSAVPFQWRCDVVDGCSVVVGDPMMKNT